MITIQQEQETDMSATARVAMFLGAGASKAFGAPLNNEILPTIIKKIKDESLFGNDVEDRRTLRQLLKKIMPGIEDINPIYVQITEVLSLIDYMLLCALVPAPQEKAEHLVLCRRLLDRAILDLLPGIHRPAGEEPRSDLQRLAKWMFDVGNKSHFSLVSTNYDEIVERGLYECFMHSEDTVRRFDRVNKAVNFGLNWRDGESDIVFQSPLDSRHSVLKLHGSVDWMKCELCGWIVCNDGYALKNEPFHVVSDQPENPFNRCHCGHSPLSPVMVAPSLVRDIRDINILNVWKSACEELRTADHWFMIGYSLPVEDYAIRSMLIRALKTRKSRPQIDVYLRHRNPETEARYGAFLGEFTYHTTGMEGFIAEVVDKRLYVDAPELQASNEDLGSPMLLNC
jgi:NAD-dependent SIR2 family protein deacetylase